jgi:hypothetical protein
VEGYRDVVHYGNPAAIRRHLATDTRPVCAGPTCPRAGPGALLAAARGGAAGWGISLPIAPSMQSFPFQAACSHYSHAPASHAHPPHACARAEGEGGDSEK